MLQPPIEGCPDKPRIAVFANFTGEPFESLTSKMEGFLVSIANKIGIYGNFELSTARLHSFHFHRY